MKKSWFTKLMVFALTLVLAIGPGAFVPAMASAADDLSVAMSDMSTMDMSAMADDAANTDHASCCPSSDQHHDGKADACAAACAAMAQAALPVTCVGYVRLSSPLVYVRTNSFAVGLTTLPDYPPPKA